MYNFIKEGSALIKVPAADKISRQMQVFYNPVMKLNRDISILLLNSLNRNSLRIASPLAGTGVREIRFLKELGKGKIKEIQINDYSSKATSLVKSNLKLNKIKISGKKIRICNQDANLFLLESTGFDYIDIDPFGTPNPFLDSAVRRISRDGILAVTATDTGCLCGTYPSACLRKYWAMPKRSAIMHETGLRILIRKIQLIGAQYDKALTPIFSYSKEHYFRVFLKCEKGKGRVDKVLKEHRIFNDAGPMWLGNLWDCRLTNKIYKSINKNLVEESLIKFLKIIKDESKIDTIGFYDIHYICKKYKIKQIPKKQELIQNIKKLGCKASETHFNPEAVRSDIELKKLLKLI